MKKNILFLHTTGNWWDHRYYFKQMPALVNAGFSVSYLVETSETIDNPQINTITVSKKTAKRARFSGGFNLLWKVLKSDVSIAKNYLNKKEIDELNRIVTMYLDYAENQAARQIPMKMRDWVEKLDAFLQFNDYFVLKDSGKISAEVAKKLAMDEFEKFRIIQDETYESDFDKEIKRIQGE